MVLVKVHSGESFEEAFRRFKKQCEKEGIIISLKRKEYHMKPSELRRRRIAKAKKKRLNEK